MRQTFAERNRSFYLSLCLFIAGVALVWLFFMPSRPGEEPGNARDGTIRLADGQGIVRLNAGMQVLSDPGGAMTFEQAREAAARFVPAEGHAAFGIDGDAYWVRATIVNETTTSRWALRLLNAAVDTAELYVDGRRMESKEVPGTGQPLDDHYWAYELELPSERPVELYIRATTEGSMILPLELATSTAYGHKLRSEYLLFGLYYGFALLMAAYTLSIFAFTGNASYVFYSLYIVCFALSQAFWNGLPQELLGERSGILRLLLRAFDTYEGIFLFFFILCLWFGLFFLNRVLQLSVYAPRMRDAARVLQGVSPLVVMALLFHWPGFSTIAIWYEFIVFLFVIASTYISVFRGNIAARYIALGMIAIIGLMMPAVLYTFGLADYNVLTHYGYQLGSIAEFIVFTAALSYQTRQTAREKDLARRESQEKLVRMLERWNEDLERTVDERTAELVQAQQRRNELLQNLSHDVRSPLTVVQGGIKAMMLGIEVHPGERRKHLESLYGKVVYVTRFIDDLFRLSMAEQEAAASSEATEELRAAQWAEQEFAFLEGFVRNAGLRCETEVRVERDIVVTLDTHGMRRALLNLVHNACQYSAPGRQVTLRATIGEAGVAIGVEDEGQGIAPEDLKVIFARLNRGSQADPSTGSGLGLAIAKEIVERHGGTISAESEPGKGSRFVVQLPGSGGMRVA